MQWEGREESDNVEDRRGYSKTGMAAVGGGGIIVVVIALIFGLKPEQVAQVINPNKNQQQQQQENGKQLPKDPAEEKLAKFTRVIFRDTEVIWENEFRKLNKTYQKPTLVLFHDEVRSACGSADSAVGPFYCPGDDKVYIDLSFFRELEQKLNAPGEFARAYVLAHEVGHHVQKLLGFSQRVDEARRRNGINSQEAHRMSVRLELQADFLAGVWANQGQKQFKFLDSGDIDSALKAAFEIGDDRLQKKARGHVMPDSFTHGTSKQRMRWFKMGFDTGDVTKMHLLFDLKYEEL